MQIEFQWDERKNALNQKKHGISFDEAKQALEESGNDLKTAIKNLRLKSL